MRGPILKQGRLLVVCIHADQTDREFLLLRDELALQIGQYRIRGVVIDVSTVDVLDSFSCRTLRGISHTAALRGAETIVVGIQPDVAFAMVQLGLTMDGVTTALDLEEGMELALARMNRQGNHD